VIVTPKLRTPRIDAKSTLIAKLEYLTAILRHNDLTDEEQIKITRLVFSLNRVIAKKLKNQ
jgi:hypothetical protein